MGKSCLMSANLGWTPQESPNLDSLEDNYTKMSLLTTWNVLLKLIWKDTPKWCATFVEKLFFFFPWVNLRILIFINAVKYYLTLECWYLCWTIQIKDKQYQKYWKDEEEKNIWSSKSSIYKAWNIFCSVNGCLGNVVIFSFGFCRVADE